MSALQKRRDELMADAEALTRNADGSPRGITRAEERQVRDILAEVDRIDLRVDAAEHLRRRPVSVRPTTPADDGDAPRRTSAGVTARQRSVMVGRLDYLQARFGLDHPHAGREIRELHRRLARAH